MRYALVTLSLLLVPIVASAQSPPAAAPHVIIGLPDALTWGPAPAILPPGASLAVIEGDPGKPGEFTMRLRMPAGYRIPPHFHPVTEHVTVISGSFHVGMGERFDESKGTTLPTGTFAALAPGVRHFAWTTEETVLQLHGTGPWSLTYVDPADDPRTPRR